MNDAVASLQAIRDGFAALRAENAELRAENEALKNKLDGAILNIITPELEAAKARIAELETAHRWIPIGERLPAAGQTIYGWIHPVSYVPGNAKELTYMPMLNHDYPWRSTWDMATYSLIDVTHWMPLPFPPEVTK